MGIRGLTSFIEDSQLLKDYQLSKHRAVIDGNNLYHFISSNGRTANSQLGGDYDAYRREILRIFSVFTACNIKVFVVFDGAYTTDGRKRKTTVNRMLDKINNSHSIMHGGEESMLPCLAELTFRQTLDELGIPHITCDFEADDQMVTLANLWGCSIISNDSDFYMCHVAKGVIPLKHINFNLCHLQQGANLPVKFYHIEEFQRRFGRLRKPVLPLFASVLGNDFIDLELLRGFHTAISRRYRSSGRFWRIHSILRWLEGKECVKSLISEVVRLTPRAAKRELRNSLLESVSMYKGQRLFTSFNLQSCLEGERSAAGKKTNTVRKSDGQRLPVWFVKGCRLGEIPVFLLNAALSQVVFMQVQVEDTSAEASSLMSMPLREVSYGLLLANTEVVGEVTRNGLNLEQLSVHPRLVVTTSRQIVTLEKIPFLEAAEKKTILLNTALEVSADFVDKLDPALQLYMASLVFWVRRAKPPLNFSLLKAIVLCAVLMQVEREMRNARDGTADASASARQLTEDLSELIDLTSEAGSADGALLKNVGEKLDWLNPMTSSSCTWPDPMISSLTAQFQACLLSSIQLNCLLQCPLPTPQPASLYNGTFIFAVVRGLQDYPHPERLPGQWLAQAPSLLQKFEALCSAVVEETGVGVRAEGEV